MASNGNTTNGLNHGGARDHDVEKATNQMSNEERTAALHAAKFGYGPLAHIGTNDARAALPG
jgi:hypothetical protein